MRFLNVVMKRAIYEEHTKASPSNQQLPTQQNTMDMKTQSDKLWDLYKERRESSLLVSFSNGTESLYYSTNPPKPGAADRQKLGRRQRGCRGHGGCPRIKKDAGAAKTALQPHPPTLLSREHRHRCLRHALLSKLDASAWHQMFQTPPNSNSGT